MIAFIGGGNMAEALIRGMRGAGSKEEIIVSEPLKPRRDHLASAYSVRATESNIEAVRPANIIVLAVKPQQMEAVLTELSPEIDNTKTVVSIAAGITLSYYQSRLKTDKIVRVMPNVAAIKGEAMSVLSLCECFTGPEIERVKELFMSSGRVLMLPERHMDAVTAVSGSGPAFIALFIGSMMKAGVSLGLAEDDARALAVQTLRGTAELLDGDFLPEKLIEIVRSPGGTTAEGLKVFGERGLEETVRLALEAAARRSKELSR